ncbi:HesA/MoeB/ThiF family protein [Pediococcus ethanolidurans]|uniref:THIF-type NAD/FAD binding fold domain-containing protein n=2 Tax=Pediococcus ethanolidurans TaxID=319653 RepID=A0A0R2K653_9LACO|nr:ThiF family adenylyltransferase [Pediococcus ethanolidurans]KRN82652.1 hypothetical protein IV87_GL002036 [Pediococcus ethanolidurans]
MKFAGEILQPKIHNMKICIIGAGAVGSLVAVMTVTSGVGRIRLVDGDVVEESNLTRQIFYQEEDINKEFKVNLMKRFISEINLNVNFEPVTKYANIEEKNPD